MHPDAPAIKLNPLIVAEIGLLWPKNALFKKSGSGSATGTAFEIEIPVAALWRSSMAKSHPTLRPFVPSTIQAFVYNPPAMTDGKLTQEQRDQVTGLYNMLGQVMLRDAIPLRRQFHTIRHRMLLGQVADDLIARFLRDAEGSIALRQRRLESRPTITYPEQLPVSARRADIAAAIRDHQVTILCGATGSGKTTQLPKICLDLGRGIAGTIGHTQPRRIAARSVAQRIASELSVPIGSAVGFKVRFTDQASPGTLVKLMTDGILLAEIQSDRLLSQYDTIIIDEAHERSLNIDFLIGYFKQLLPRRPDLKLIITSATIAPERFAAHFDKAPILMVEGRAWPVEVRYRPLREELAEELDNQQTDGILRAIDELWQGGAGAGDTLIFLAGEREIRETAEALQKHHPRGVEIIPLYSRLSAEEQMRVFSPHGQPRLVLATNIAETSLTVPGIRYVIDPGLARISRYAARGTVQRLPIEPISRASADQRKGRCGRTSPGICIRLYPEDRFLARDEFTDPEINRTHLASVILQMKSLRLGRIEDFPFLDPPDYRQVRDGYQTLHELGAIDEQNELTDIGRLLSRLPVDPRLGRMLLASKDHGCLAEALVIVSALSVQDPRERPMDQQQAADAAHRDFRDEGSDFLSLLKLWQFYEQSLRQMSENKVRKLCRDRFLSFLRLREWRDIHSQLKELTSEFGWRTSREPARPEVVHQALLAGLISNVGTRGDDFEYQGLRGKRFFIFPGSSQFEKKPQWVVAAEIVQTSRQYARTVAAVQPEWIEQAAAHMVRREYDDPSWQRRAAQVIAYEKVSLQGLCLIPRRKIDYGPVDPKTSRELFIQGALIREDFDCDAPFFRHNIRLRRDVEMLEAMQRRHDLLVGPQAIFDFYDLRLPAAVVSGDSFTQWRRGAEEKDRRLLFMRPEDLLCKSADHLSEARFPTTLQVGDARLALQYRFDVTDPADGVSVVVPLSLLNQFDPRQLDWLVPGLAQEKIVELIRLLPKDLRVQLVPAPQSAAAALEHLHFGEGDFRQVVALALGKQIGQIIKPDLLHESQLDPYLRMNIMVVDERGKLITQGRDLAKLTHQLREQTRQALLRHKHAWHRDGIRSWNIPDLPEKVEFHTGGLAVQGFPALIDCTKHVSLRLLEDKTAAERELRKGVRRLAMISLEDTLNWQFKILPHLDKLVLLYKPLGDKQTLRDQFTLSLADHLMFPAGAAPFPAGHAAPSPPIRTRMEYELRLDAAWNAMRPSAEQLAQWAIATLEARVDVSSRLTQPFAPMIHPPIIEMQQHLADLVGPDFLSRTPWPWLMHLPRFISGIRIRLQKLTNAGLLRDRQNADALAPLVKTWQDRVKLTVAQNLTDPQLDEMRWLIEELRVSLFAQELKTSIPVSLSKVQKNFGAA